MERKSLHLPPPEPVSLKAIAVWVVIGATGWAVFWFGLRGFTHAVGHGVWWLAKWVFE